MPLNATRRVLWYTPSSAAVAAAAAVSRPWAKGDTSDTPNGVSSTKTEVFVAQNPAGNAPSTPCAAAVDKCITPEAILMASSLSPWSPPPTTVSPSITASSASNTSAVSTTTSSSSRAPPTTTTRNVRTTQQHSTRSDGTMAATSTSPRGGAIHSASSLDTTLAQSDALSVYGPSFQNILCANPRGRSLKKIVEMKAFKLKRRQARKAMGRGYCHRTARGSSPLPESSTSMEKGTTTSRTSASCSPNDQLVAPRHGRSQRVTVHNVGEPDALEDDDDDDEDLDEEEDLDADWVKEMLQLMEGECYYGDMPFELLHLVFCNFQRVSMDSLKQLAEHKRAQAAAVKAAERELEERWAKTPLLPVNPASMPRSSQRHRCPRACDLCQHSQHSRRLPSPTSAPHALRTRYPHQHQQQQSSPNTVHEQLPSFGRQFLAHHFASSPPSPGYSSNSSSEVPHYTNYSDESDQYLGDEGGSRSELDSEVFSAEEDNDTEENGNHNHPIQQDESENMDDLVASLSISNGNQPGYTSEDVDAQSVDDNDVAEHDTSDYETRSRQTTRAHIMAGRASNDSRTRSTSTSSTTSSALAGYTKAGRDDYCRRLRYHQHFHHRRDLHSPPRFSGLDSSTLTCHCHRDCGAHHWPNGLRAFRKTGINRVGEDQDEEATLHDLHRDQYFHPITHVALRSDLYVCSLVNRQWRLAALQLMWQSVVLDVESCRLERLNTVDCTCHPTHHPARTRASGRRSGSPPTRTNFASGRPSPKISSGSSTNAESRSCSHNPTEQCPFMTSSPIGIGPSSSSSSSSSPSSFSSTTSTRISRRLFSPSRTRLETMLDSYLELYHLDLAKNVQTVELDLQLLATWSSNDDGNITNIKRILQRLAPFNHLRLICAQRPTSSEEESAANFRLVMEGLYGHIRHLHFSPGFAISRAWVQEMDRMPGLEKLTLESLNSMERVDYDWSRIRTLVLHAIVPPSLFGIPRLAPISPTPPTPPPTPHTSHETGGPAGSGFLSMLPAPSSTSNNAVIGESTTDISLTVAEHVPPLYGNILASPQPLPGTDPPLSSLNTVQGTSTFVGAPNGAFLHLYSHSPSPSPLTFMPSSHTSTSLVQYLQQHPVTKLVRQPRPGWWLWNGLRHLEIQMRNVVLPREWLQELVAVLSHRARAEQDLLQMHEQETNVFRRPSNSVVSRSSSTTSTSGSKFELYQEHMLQEQLRNMYGLGPRIEVFRLDCEVSHPHKEIMMDLMSHWGYQLREFHFSQSAELTDEFFWCCLQHGKNLRRLSLKDSKGITGEGVEVSDQLYHDHQHSHHRQSWTDQPPSALSNGEERRTAVGGLFAVPPLRTNSVDSSFPESIKVKNEHDFEQATKSADSLSYSSTDKAKSESRRATPRVVIGWRSDFKELRLDQSRVRSECLVALKRHCPGMRYKVRDVRWSNGQRRPDEAR
ncbi:hypothetical protein BGZ73_004113 [Actinomortierella ambigua]|nr:hypothetical protein BGZ73_004113 [Actinomortierella ambigua]